MLQCVTIALVFFLIYQCLEASRQFGRELFATPNWKYGLRDDTGSQVSHAIQGGNYGSRQGQEMARTNSSGDFSVVANRISSAGNQSETSGWGKYETAPVSASDSMKKRLNYNNKADSPIRNRKTEGNVEFFADAADPRKGKKVFSSQM